MLVPASNVYTSALSASFPDGGFSSAARRSLGGKRVSISGGGGGSGFGEHTDDYTADFASMASTPRFGL